MGKSEAQKAYKAKNKAHIRTIQAIYWKGYRDRHLERRYALPIGEYQRLFDAQHGLCAVCQQPETALRYGKVMNLAVDHNHTTGQVRGLLCYACNRALGLFHDSVERLQAATHYLQQH